MWHTNKSYVDQYNFTHFVFCDDEDNNSHCFGYHWNTNAKEQSVRIKGRFTCHGLPAQYAEVQLVSKKIIGGDAFARDVFSDPSGAFEIAGYIDWSKYSKIDVRLYIWHNCFEKPYEQSDPCKNWFEFKVPNIFINDGTLAQKKWELGEVKLETPKYGKTLDACD